MYLKLFCEGLLPGAAGGQRILKNGNIGKGQLIQQLFNLFPHAAGVAYRMEIILFMWEELLMNKVFKVIWSEARNAYVVVSEIAKIMAVKAALPKSC